MVSTTRTPGSRRGLGWIFLLVGLVTFFGLAVAATIVGVNEYRKADWPVTEGEVIDVVQKVNTRRDNDGHRRTSITWAPVVRYTVDGNEYSFTSKVSTGTKPTIGSTVEVRYNPDDPQQAGLASGVLWVVFMLGGMAVLFLAVFGGTGLVLMRRQRSAPPPPYQPPPYQPYQPPHQQGSQPGAEPDGPIDPSEPR